MRPTSKSCFASKRSGILGESALVTGRLLRERVMGGKTITDNWRFTKVYAISGGRWQVIAWHASPAPQ